MARFEYEQKIYLYRDYVATSLQLIPQQKHIVRTYDEVLHPEKVDNRDGDEIAEDIIARAGLQFGE